MNVILLVANEQFDQRYHAKTTFSICTCKLHLDVKPPGVVRRDDRGDVFHDIEPSVKQSEDSLIHLLY
jgi:hypothetical protein